MRRRPANTHKTLMNRISRAIFFLCVGRNRMPAGARRAPDAPGTHPPAPGSATAIAPHTTLRYQTS